MLNKLKNWFLSRTFFEYLAYIFLLAGLVFFVIIYADYKYPLTSTYIDIDDFGQLGAMLSGTSGVLWALSGVLLFFSALKYQREDLKLQRDELSETRAVMKEQSETLKTQTAESVFFRLLENHRSLVDSLSFDSDSGYQGLTKYYRTLKNNTALYRQAAVTGNIIKTEYGQYYPLRMMDAQIENIEQISNNTLHLITLIKQKLNDDVFYHQTLYNSLSKAEKYILGLYSINQKTDASVLFKTTQFNYLEYFENSGNSYYDKGTMPFFPQLDFNFIRTRADFSLSNYHTSSINRDVANLKIKIIKNELHFPIVLKQMIFEYEWRGQNFITEDDWSLEFNDECTINIFETINGHVFKAFVENFNAILRRGFPFNFYFSLKLVFTYNNRNYTYRKYFNGDFNNIEEDGYADFSFSEPNS